MRKTSARKMGERRGAASGDVALLLQAMDSAGEVIVIYRADPDGELRLAYTNDAHAEQTGYTREDAIGKTLDAFRQAMPDDEGMRTIRDSIAAGKSIEVEAISYRKDGSSYWNHVSMHPIVDSDKQITHWVSTERDITEGVDKTAALEHEHDQLLALTRAARRLFTALDARTLIATLRTVIRELLGIDARVLVVSRRGAIEVEEIGRLGDAVANVDGLVDDALAQRARVVSPSRDRAVAYAGRFGDEPYVLDLRSQPGHQLRANDLFVIDLLAEYFGVAARNVTLYHELDERRAAVLELSQTKSDLITMLAHDFRGPLTSIVGFADLTTEVGNVSEEQRDFLETIKRSALQLSDLATDTLTLARLERNEVALTLDELDIEVLMRAIVAQYADRRSIELNVRGNSRIVGDDERLRQVFSNLLDNAVKYSPDGSSPDVSIDGEGEGVTVRVRDRGIGIPTGELTRVFDRFTRASNARRLRIQGTGFGLFLTKQLVALHGGTIAVESVEGEGSTFVVTLPRRVSRTSAPRTAVVLDPERDRSFLAYGLREAGYRVVTVAAIEDLLAFADSQTVDAVLVNVPDPELRGERAVQLRAFSREHNIPIVAIADETRPLLGAVATLVRPVLIGDVVATLERYLGPPATP